MWASSVQWHRNSFTASNFCIVGAVSFQEQSQMEVTLSKIAAFENFVVRIPAKLELKQEAAQHHMS